ncbi:MAG TPA: ABC transporter ATP-binding protein [Chloroflexota bacterium]|nr:ABC transporter ATP-binding protein [Chloroflexota bacterium]
MGLLMEAPPAVERQQDLAPVLDVRRLTTEFKTHAGSLRAVNDMSFTLSRGRVLAVIGESGSGKSALLRTILDMQPSTARIQGEVLLNGVDLLKLTMRQREDLRGSVVSMVFQDPMTALDPIYTVEQQLVETIRRHTPCSRRQARARALELLELVQIPSPERRLAAYPFELSGGMRQRLVIATALASTPSLLLVDEPTTALDVTVQGRVLRLLGDLQRQLGMSVIFVTHDLSVAAQIADDVAVMYAGRIVESGSIRDVVRTPAHPYTRGHARHVCAVAFGRTCATHVLAGPRAGVLAKPD